jgi:hypothetical protein
MFYFGFSGNSPSMSNENHFIFTWRLAVSITTSKNKKGNIDSKFVIIVTVSVAVGGIVIIAFVCYILWKSKTFRDFLQGFKIRSSGYVDKLKRSSSMRLLWEILQVLRILTSLFRILTSLFRILILK